MRNRYLALLSTLVLVLVLAVPAAAGGPNDNGNGYREIYRSEYSHTTTGSFKVCEDGEDTNNNLRIPNSMQTELLVGWEKADGSANRRLNESSTVSPDGLYRFESRLESMLNHGFDGGATVMRGHVMLTWSDPHGVYAYGKGNWHNTYNAGGEFKADTSNNSGFVCMRDTILP